MVYIRSMGRNNRAKEPPQEFRAKLFQNGRSQALRLPKELRFEGQAEVRIHREGNRLIVEPLEPEDTWSEAFLATAGAEPDFAPPERTPLRAARDRFGRS
jgi:antitoxin VapB